MGLRFLLPLCNLFALHLYMHLKVFLWVKNCVSLFYLQLFLCYCLPFLLLLKSTFCHNLLRLHLFHAKTNFLELIVAYTTRFPLKSFLHFLRKQLGLINLHRKFGVLLTHFPSYLLANSLKVLLAELNIQVLNLA